MKNILFSLCLFFLMHGIYAQVEKHILGELTKEEREMKSYAKAPESEAVILFDVGQTVFFETKKGYDFNIRFTHRKRIKILKRSGLKYAEVSIPYYVNDLDESEEIVSIKAFSYNEENGKLIKKALDKHSIYTERLNNRLMLKKFVFPKAKEGSIIEYEYVLESPFLFNLPDWSFQSEIPTLYSEYMVSIVPFYLYIYIAKGITNFNYYNSITDKNVKIFGDVVYDHGRNIGSGVEYQEKIHTFVMKDIPAFLDESYITSKEDYLMQLDFQLSKITYPSGTHRDIITTWPNLNQAMLKHQSFGKYIKSSKKYASKILKEKIYLKEDDPIQNVKSIVEYVKIHYKWNEKYSRYASKTAKEFMLQKTGNSTDINLFLCALLQKAGIDAKAVLISTRQHGKIKLDYPFEHFFNSTVIYIDDQQDFLCDGCEPLLPFNRNPPACINDRGLVVDDKETKWVDLSFNEASLENTNINMSIDPETAVAKSTISINATNYEAFAYRKIFEGDSAKLSDYFIKNGLSMINRIKTLNQSKINKAYTVAAKGESSIEMPGDLIIIKPFLDFPIKENKLKQEERSYPVDFIFPESKSYRSNILIPEGYVAQALPKNHEIDTDLAQIKISYKSDNKAIKAEISYTFKKAVYQTNEYSRIKSYFDLLVKNLNTPILLKKETDPNTAGQASE